MYFRMVQNTPWCFSPSLTDVWGPHVSFSFNLRCFFLLPPTPGLVARPHRTPPVAARPPARPGILPGDLLLMVEVEAPHGSAFCAKMVWRPGSCGGGPRGRAPVACRARGDSSVAARAPERPRPAGLAATAAAEQRMSRRRTTRS